MISRMGRALELYMNMLGIWQRVSGRKMNVGTYYRGSRGSLIGFFRLVFSVLCFGTRTGAYRAASNPTRLIVPAAAIGT
jgi:hypothetical protein